MKRNILIFYALLVSFLLQAQQASYTFNSPVSGVYVARDQIRLLPGFHCSGSSGTFRASIDPTLVINITPTITPTPIAPSSNHNYIVSTVAIKAVADASAFDDNNSNTTVQYFDGLGRLEQTVQKAITPRGDDLTSAVVYDSFGRDSLKWLPGAVAGNSGAYVTNFGTPAVTTNGDNSPYATTEYEPSPLNRVTGQYGPGADWYSNSKKKSITYTANAANTVKLFEVNGTGLTVTGYYDPNTLYGQRTTDEDGKWVEEFTDKQGKKVLNRTYDSTYGNHDTYYVYDDFDNLRYVLPPLASDSLLAGTPWNNDFHILRKYGYLYTYDGRKRCISKRLPGCDWINMAYDKADQLVMSQDGNQQLKQQWTVNKYDVFGRLLYSGLVNDNRTGSQMATDCAGLLFTETTGSSTVPGYTCNNITPTTLLTVNYYDSYSFVDVLNEPMKTQLTGIAKDGYTTPDKDHVKTMLTGTRVYHLDDPNKYEVTALYYDKYGRTVQTRASNHLGGYDIVYDSINFVGKPTKTLKTHCITGTTPIVTELYRYTYDHAQRLLTTTHQLNGGNTVTLVSNSYDNLGRVSSKTLGGANATTYSYNVRGWITGISGNRFAENLYYNTAPGIIAPFSPTYNGNIGAMKWNTPADGINRDRIYTFRYNGLNRLKDATYSELEGYTVVNSNRYNEQFEYDKMGNITTFARNGLQSTTPGLVYSTIDDLKLDHTGNQLTKVTENGYGKYLSDNIYYGDEEFVPNQANTGYCSAYDANGNRLYDSNSNIWKINYNVLNLPDAMQFYHKHRTYYTYSASGAKLKVVDKTAVDGPPLPVSSLNSMPSDITFSSTTTTDYVGNYIYENSSLTRILLPEGYYQNGAYYYYLKDHLGSNRVVVQNNGSVVETSSYYPSGMRFGESVASGGNVQPYRHTGHEMQAMHGLNWIDNNARFRTVSDGAGFTGLDPLAEKYYSISPYAYCIDNPVKLIDGNGKQPGEPRISTGMPAKIQPNGALQHAMSTTYMPAPQIKEMRIYDPIKNILSKQQPETVTRTPSNVEKTLKATADNPITQLETSPVIQGTAVGTLTAIGIIAAPTVIPAVQATGTIISTAVETTTAISLTAGAIDGVVKSVLNAPPDTPYIITNPAFQISSDITNFGMNFLLNAPASNNNQTNTSNDKKKIDEKK